MESLQCLNDLKTLVIDLTREHVHGITRRGQRVPVSLAACALLIELAQMGVPIAPYCGHWGHGSPVIKILTPDPVGC